MIEAFEFADGDKTYRCQVRMPAGSGEAWWWFTVSGDQQNYAPFRAEKGDTKKTVQPRIVGFYKHRLARLAEPPVQRNRGRPPGSGAKPVVAAAAAAEARKWKRQASRVRPDNQLKAKPGLRIPFRSPAMRSRTSPGISRLSAIAAICSASRHARSSAASSPSIAFRSLSSCSDISSASRL